MGFKAFLSKVFGDSSSSETTTHTTTYQPKTYQPNGVIEHTRFFARVAEAMTNYGDVHLYIVHHENNNRISYCVYSFDMNMSMIHLLKNFGISDNEISYLKSLNSGSDSLRFEINVPTNPDNDFNTNYYAEQVKKFYPSCTMTVKPDGILADSRER